MWRRLIPVKLGHHLFRQFVSISAECTYQNSFFAIVGLNCVNHFFIRWIRFSLEAVNLPDVEFCMLPSANLTVTYYAVLFQVEIKGITALIQIIQRLAYSVIGFHVTI